MAGSIVKSIESASGVKATIISPTANFLIDSICAEQKIDKKECLVITGVEDAEQVKSLGIDNLLVIRSKEDYEIFEKVIIDKNKIPTYYSESL